MKQQNQPEYRATALQSIAGSPPRCCARTLHHRTAEAATRLAFKLLVTSLGCLYAVAQPILVDFNFNNKPLSQTADPAYTPWSTNAIWHTGGDAMSNTFRGVTFTFRRVGLTGTGLTTDWYSAGIASAKLVNDGITVAPLHITNTVGVSTAPGARIELTISNLAAGPHTLLTWHNTWQNPASYTFSPLNIYLNGTQIITNLPVSNRVTNNADAAYSYVEFIADGLHDAVITYEASTNFTVTDANPCIDGFELDTPNFKFKANKPSPTHGDEHVDADATRSVLLRWNKATLAVSNRVYFGTSSNAVLTAAPASPEFKGSQVATNLLVTNLSSLATYWWRVDQVNATNGVTKGDLWMFRTRHLAFPGAEGYGRFARGGRGGVVVKVTNLNNSGTGSFRDAIEGDYGPRTVIFDVSGLITLESDVILSGSRPCITVAGQTAPGKGICFRKQQFALSGATDAIVRFVRVRVGDISGETQNGSGLAGVNHTIMDHCSISWGLDEEMSTRNAKNVTLQRTLISEALNIAGHQNYPAGTRHGYAASVDGDIASLHHNLLAHCEGRNWSMAGGLDANGCYAGRLDIFNNVVYNWRSRTTDGGAHEVNFVANYYKAGAASTYSRALNAQYGGFPGTQQYYFEGNVMTPGGSVNTGFSTNHQAAGKTTSTENGGTLPDDSNPPYSAWVSAPFFPSFATIDEVTNAYRKVLSDVGCNQPQMDDHDARVIRETLDGTYTYTGQGPYGGSPGLPNSQNDVGGWEDYGNAARPADWDTDNDGLPNWWEQLKGLNPNSPPGDFSDSNGDPDGDEYTNLEDYLNWLAAPHFDCLKGTSLDVDLTQFTRGFTNNGPVYTVTVPTNGTVTLVGGGRTARFTPTPGFTGLEEFRFSVTDACGATMTNVVGLRVRAPLAPALQFRRLSGALALDVGTEAGLSYGVQMATQLSGWSTVATLAGTGATASWTNAISVTEPQRFYRIITPP